MNAKSFTLTLCAAFALTFISCATTQKAEHPEQKSDKPPRTITVNGIAIYEDMTDSGFSSWTCTDSSDSGLAPFEVGFFSERETRYGYVSYDEGQTAQLAFFIREGLDLRWDFGPENVFRVVIKPDGTAYFYDFTYALAGEITDDIKAYTAVKRE